MRYCVDHFNRNGWHAEGPTRRMRSQQGLLCYSMSLTTQVGLPLIAPESIQMTFCEAPVVIWCMTGGCSAHCWVADCIDPSASRRHGPCLPKQWCSRSKSSGWGIKQVRVLQVPERRMHERGTSLWACRHRRPQPLYSIAARRGSSPYPPPTSPPEGSQSALPKSQCTFCITCPMQVPCVCR